MSRDPSAHDDLGHDDLGHDDLGPDDPEHEGWAERLVDEIVPEGVEWRRLVGRYPRATVVGAAIAGFVLGRSRGLSLAAALSGFVVGEVSHGLESAARSLSSLRDELDTPDDE